MVSARYHPGVLSQIAVNRDAEFIALLVPVSFMPGGFETPNTRRTFDLAHGVCQTLAGDKLHKTNLKDHTDFTSRPARVKEIGPPMSEVSDSHDASGLLSLTRYGTRDRLRTVCCLCSLAFGTSFRQ